MHLRRRIHTFCLLVNDSDRLTVFNRRQGVCIRRMAGAEQTAELGKTPRKQHSPRRASGRHAPDKTTVTTPSGHRRAGQWPTDQEALRPETPQSPSSVCTTGRDLSDDRDGPCHLSGHDPVKLSASTAGVSRTSFYPARLRVTWPRRRVPTRLRSIGSSPGETIVRPAIAAPSSSQTSPAPDHRNA
jgi:hypothetical protein